MVFTKSFPRDVKGTTTWHEIALSPYEEKYVEKTAREEHISTMLECIRDAKEVIAKGHLKFDQHLIMSIALSLFTKRSSHVAFSKEEKCRDIFEKKVTQSSGRERQKG